MISGVVNWKVNLWSGEIYWEITSLVKGLALMFDREYVMLNGRTLRSPCMQGRPIGLDSEEIITPKH